MLTWCWMPFAGPASRSSLVDVWAVLMALCALSALLSWPWQYDRHHPASLCKCTSSLIKAVLSVVQVFANTML